MWAHILLLYLTITTPHFNRSSLIRSPCSVYHITTTLMIIHQTSSQSHSSQILPFHIEETEEDILQRLTNKSNTIDRDECPVDIISEAEEEEELSDEIPSSSHLIISSSSHQSPRLRLDHHPSSKRNRTLTNLKKAHISTTIKKLAWLSNLLFPHRLVRMSLSFMQTMLRTLVWLIYTSISRLGFILRSGIEILWDQLIFPAAFPIRLLFQIFVMIPISMIIQVYQALQPLFVFITSAVTLGVLMGLAGGLSHAILGDWMQTYFTSSLSASRSSVAPTPAPTRRKITSGVRPPIKISGRKRISESPETQWAHGLDFASSSALELKPRLSSRSSTTSSTNTSSIMKGSRQHRSSVSPSSVLSTRSSSDGSMSVISSTKGKKKVTFKND